ncbi:type I-C CRISPR-associated protein Cas8c/Csd1 [Natribacillus halophilus]|uniref:CRISPR-associated protein, Csd1 family n=1 Tax=Natribacillus halophilus TaxID=549003 RepID=A0A1G8SSQ1_9BACI|nr:type I-C CRISPR-associated protein Cas8c/Csd1 [Natribacillus halophilus]SDJ32211.1 CRISPR-associated protein, Csd1 family [Natribacillus halophilus]
MSWLLELYQTYENNLQEVGKVAKKRNDQEYTLLPISHTTQTAHIEVNITEEGDFHSANAVDKKDGSTLIPSTESSSSRAGSKIAPYPLHDKLSYVAGDYMIYGGEEKKKKQFEAYIEQLGDWVASPYSHEKVKTIYTYLQKKQLIQDLIKENVLVTDSYGYLIHKWEKKHKEEYGDKPQIFSVIGGSVDSAFVRFNVYSTERRLDKAWNDQTMYDSFVDFYRTLLQEEDICFVTGKMEPTTESHTNKIRHPGDKAKLISANDSSGFTYRGRFRSGDEAATISYDVSQKAHNALKWLIHRQGKIIDQRVFLVWGNDTVTVPEPEIDTFDIHPEAVQNAKKIANTQEVFAKEVAKAFDGYKSDLSNRSNVNILILDSATTGRLAVLYYRNMNKELYLDRLKNWHSTCLWLHRYRKNTENEFIEFYGAPSTRDIAVAAYGSRANDKLIKGLMERMIPCIVDERKIPQDISRSLFHRASNPVSMERWEWEKTLSIACAIINRQEGYSVALNHETNNRDYLFGRLLAIADVLERRALGSEETRSSNAIRYMNSFSKHPARTWKTIQESLQPYQARLGTKAGYLSSMIDEVASRIDIEDFNDKPLSGKYLLGFYSQRHELYQKKSNNQSKESEEE